MFSPNEVKEELDVIDGELFCNTCLATDRALRPLQQYNNLCQKLFDTVNLAYGLDHMNVCWECLATVRSVTSFVEKVRVAQDILRESQKIPTNSLSLLTPVLITDYNFYINEEECSATEILDELTVVKVEHDSKEQIVQILQVNDVDKKATELLADIKDDYHFDNDYESYFLGHAVDNSIANQVTQRRKLKDRSYNYKIIDDVFSFKNNYRKLRVNEQELKYWLDRDKEHHHFVNRPYKCEMCILGFAKKRKLIQHNKVFHSEEAGIYICDICQTRVLNKNRLSRHCQLHYYIYKCDICQYKCHRPNFLYEHFRKEHNKKFQCLKCGLRFTNASLFYKHFREIHIKYICDYCGKVCYKRNVIQRHIQRYHIQHKCRTCNVAFKGYNTYKNHITLKHTKEDSEEAYCVECDMKFDNVALFRRHVQYTVKHMAQRNKLPKLERVPCPECGKQYARKTFMMNHYRLVHLKKTKHYCVDCDKYFLNTTRYKEHRKYKHEGYIPELNKLCSICGRGFAQARTLLNHVRTHTGERPHACPHCPAKFVQKYAMQTHVNTIHLKMKRRVHT